MKTILIVGGGFSGTMTAVNIARFSEEPLRVVIVNSTRSVGRGAAYDGRRAEHLLNVAARNMSAFPDRPEHFFEWLRSRFEFDDMPDAELRELFVPRPVFGDYVRGLLAAATSSVSDRSPVTVEVIDDTVLDIVASPDSGGTVILEQGKKIAADVVVLATGNQAPASFSGTADLVGNSRYCADPWGDWWRNPPKQNGRVVLLGTSLTMVDVVITLKALGWKGQVTAISRSGMLPKSHFRGVAYPDYLPDDAASLGLEELVALVEKHSGLLKGMGQDPAIAVDKLRPHTQQIWRGLSVADKRDFLKNYATSWNIARHRIAQSIHRQITNAVAQGYLNVTAGTIDHLSSCDDGVEVRYRASEGGEHSVSGDLVINCTGPKQQFSKSGVLLFEKLLEHGLVRSDALDMGLDATEDFAVIDRNGSISPWLFAMGSLLRGNLWETTAVPELRGQAMNMGRILTRSEKSPLPTVDEPVLEYCI